MARPLAILLAAMALTRRASAEEGLPSDVRMPVRVGAGYTGMWNGSAAAGLGFEGVFIGGEIARGLRLVLLVGLDGVAARDLAVNLPDEEGGEPERSFSQGLLHVETGVGVHVGSASGGPAFELTASPGASMVSLPGPTKQHPIQTVGPGLVGRLEVMPWYLPLFGRERRGYGAWLLSGLSLWVSVRADWVEKNEGAFVGGGVGLDLARLVVAPIAQR